MPDALVEIAGLRKTYRRPGARARRSEPALDGLDLVVGEGGVHGFLGPNGSGKTTTVRALLGLTRPDAGRIALFGAEVPAALPSVIGRVGALIETPRFTGEFTGRLNLALLARIAGLPPDRVEQALEQVGLSRRADDPFAGYSLGMKQRLGIAAALMKHPRLLVLDEPSNGLDPEGIRDVRDLIRRLARGGVTILLSSHLLAEVQAVCDRVNVIARGRCVAAGAVGDLLAGPGPGDLLLRADRQEDARAVLEAAGWRVSPASAADGAPPWRVHEVADRAALTSTLAARQIFVTELVPVRRDLESAYFELMAADR